MDVIPVVVGEQDRGLDRLEFLLKLLAQRTDPRAGVEDKNLIFHTYFQAGGIAAVFVGGRPGRGQGAAGTPEFERKRTFLGH